ncbi:MAG: hypothetical protein NVS4B11_29940 [Ktedonobacteraceae bacterium]
MYPPLLDGTHTTLPNKCNDFITLFQHLLWCNATCASHPWQHASMYVCPQLKQNVALDLLPAPQFEQ